MSESSEKPHPPEGFIAAAGDVPSSAPENSPSSNGPVGSRDIETNPDESASPQQTVDSRLKSVGSATSETINPNDCDPFENGYHFPPSYPWQESMRAGAMGFARFAMTAFGFCVVVYGLLIVAWGGMIFLLLVNAAPAMCRPTCDDINSPRRIWIEIDSQVLNALFCVTGFGLAPWRIRDLVYLLQYRVSGNYTSLRRLAGIHRGWFRLGGSHLLDADVGPDNAGQCGVSQPRPAVPYPEKTTPDAPLTGIRAPPTRPWKMDFVVWTYIMNTAMQCVLSGFMWGMNRYDRPSWSTGLFVCLGMLTGAVAGWVQFYEGRRIKGFEGVAVSAEDRERLNKDREQGLLHYNNIKDKRPKNKEDKLSMQHRYNTLKHYSRV